MNPKMHTVDEGEDLIRRAEAVVDSSEWLALDDEVKAIRKPRRPPHGWKAPKLRVDPARVAREALKEAVAAGLLEEMFSDPELSRRSRDRYKELAKTAGQAKASLERLVAGLEEADYRSGNLFFHGLGFGAANQVLEEATSSLRTVALLAERSVAAAEHSTKRITPAGAAFRRGFTAEMARVYYLLTGLEPPETRKEEGTPFVRFVDAAMQAISSRDEPSCAGVLRTVLPEVREDLRNGHLALMIKEHWLLSLPDPDQNHASEGDAPTAI